MSLLHLRARGPHPAYPERAAVADARVPWANSYPRYKPVEFIHKAVADNMTSPRPWADPTNVDKKVLSSRFTLVGSVKKPRKRSLRSAGFLHPRTQRPRNPVGRTGMSERGLLGKYGPNHAADPIVMRLKPDSPTLQLQFVAIRRRDTGEWAIPGGMVEAGQTIAKTLYDEFTQEALRAIEGNDAMTDALKGQIADFFAKYLQSRASRITPVTSTTRATRTTHGWRPSPPSSSCPRDIRSRRCRSRRATTPRLSRGWMLPTICAFMRLTSALCARRKRWRSLASRCSCACARERRRSVK